MKNYSRISVCSMNIDLNLKKLLIRRYLMIVVAGQMKKKKKKKSQLTIRYGSM